jgi:glutathione S-transferase
MHSGFGELRNRCTMNCGIRVKLAAVPPALEKEIARLDELWGEGLERFGGPFLAGKSFTAADAFFAPVAFRVQTYGLKLEERSKAYVQRLLTLPALESWYAGALAEAWREPEHEEEAKAAGTWVADFRRVNDIDGD